ncbi:MAG: RNase adapter RapZ [Rhodobacterales bacterium]|nr:RNase adapter RapZ [Rhodobacterales bacterium]
MTDRPDDDAGPSARTSVLLVTGMSGAGKTSALKSLEDMGYEAVDNIPLSLLDSLVRNRPAAAQGGTACRPLAIGVDIRTRDFAIDAFAQELERLQGDPRQDVKVVFLDCDDNELRRRYTETRHRHPLAQDRPVRDGIEAERRTITPLRDRADVVIDTTGRTPGALKRILEGHFRPDAGADMTVFVTSFSFRQGIPREADLVFDVRFLANPHYDPDLRPLTGRDVAVGDYVRKDPDFDRFLAGLTGLITPLLPRFEAEGKSYLTIAVGCTGGRHRSVFVAEQLAAALDGGGRRVQISHRDLDRDRS